MAQYIYVENYGGLGKVGISLQTFTMIAKQVTDKVKGAEVLKKTSKFWRLHNPIQTMIKNGQVIISISIAIKQDVNANDVCLKIQEEVANALLAMTEQVPFKINIKIVSIE